MAIDPEDYENPSENRPGKHVSQGFQDKSGALPRPEYWDSPDVNVRARGRVGDQGVSSSTKSAKPSLTDSQVEQQSLREPEVRGESIYPYNKVTETVSGHVIEVDDSPGHERLRVKHRTGTVIELLPDGSTRLITKKNRYSLVAGNEDLVVRGVCNIVVESDANLRVQGDTKLQVDGDLSTLVQGDMNLEVKGDLTERVHGNRTQKTTGYLLEEVRGNAEIRYHSNYKCRIVGTSTINIGSDSTETVQGDSSYVIDGTYTLESEGGLIDIKTGYIHGTTAYFDNYHADGNFYGTEFHASGNILGSEVHVSTGYASTWHGNLEGNAKKSDFATTAGSAPTGSASPTTPAPQSADSAEDAAEHPESELEAVKVDAEQSETQEFIKDLDRSTVNGGFQTERLNTYKVVSRARNASLRRNSEWLQDQRNTDAVLGSITSAGGAPNAKREASSPSTVGAGVTQLSSHTTTDRTFKPLGRSTLRVTSPPTLFEISGTIRPSTRLSPNYYLSHFLGADSDVASLNDTSSGLSPTDLAKNAQLVAYNVLEPMKLRFEDNFNISEGIYNLLPNETLSGDSINVEFASGLAVGIQFGDYDNAFYYDAATWCLNNIVFDKLILSYIDYDPSGVNEPTLIVSIKAGNNSRSLSTEWNHQQISSTLRDLST